MKKSFVFCMALLTIVLLSISYVPTLFLENGDRLFCSNGLDRNEFIIAGNNCQYWYKASPDSFGKTRYYIYFDRKGKRVILEERYCDKKCYIYDCGDVYYEPKWKLKNDTVIIWGIKERKLTIISDSVIVTEDKEHHISDTLYKVTNPQLLKKLKKVPIP